ncbi:MAG TPA: plastocyanin/azurin family copper-binding protein [Solirubrobacteraceae bacterium]
MTRIFSLLLACLAVVAAGCGGGDDKSPSSQPAKPAAPSSGGASSGITITMKNIAFDPKEQTVKVGQKVTWRNEDAVDHNVVAREGAKFSSENFGEGGTYSYTPKTAGKIEYTCTLHPGMDGELTVSG